MQNIISLFKDLEEDIEKCVDCGMCQSVCPLFKVTRREPDVARGKIYILKSFSKNILSDVKKIDFNIEKCLLCNSCAEICPRGVNTLEIFLKTRIILKKVVGLSYSNKIILRQILPNHTIFDFLTKIAIKYQKDSSAVSFYAKTKKKSVDINIKPLQNKKKILFFSGCLIDKLLTNIAKSSINLLKKNGFGVIVLKNQVCCGLPSLAMGDIESFNKLVEKNIQILEKENFDAIITACPTCTYTIKELWKKFYKKNKQNQIEAISEKTEDINKFIFNNLNIKTEKKNRKTLVTYHDPCHLKKSLKIYKEPRYLIEKSGKFKIIEMENSDECCGMAGNFSLKFKKISKKIGEKKALNIKNTNAEIVITSCPACILQIKNSLPNKSVKHIVETLK